MKKTWQAPQLIVLTRTEPEETVLTGCKTLDFAYGSAATGDGHCDVLNACRECNVVVNS